MHPPKSAERSTFNHKMGQKWGFCRRVKGGEVQKVHFLCPKGPHFGGPAPPLQKQSILATGLVINSYVLHCLESQEVVHIFAINVHLWWSLDKKVAFFNGQVGCVEKSKQILPTWDPFPLIMSHRDRSLFEYKFEEDILTGNCAVWLKDGQSFEHIMQ